MNDDLALIIEAAHAAGALLIVVVTETVSMGLLKSPGAMGADIVVAEAPPPPPPVAAVASTPPPASAATGSWCRTASRCGSARRWWPPSHRLSEPELPHPRTG